MTEVARPEEEKDTKVEWRDAPWFWFLPDAKYNAARTREIIGRVKCPECDKEKAND
jgi:hypothetical protein